MDLNKGERTGHKFIIILALSLIPLLALLFCSSLDTVPGHKALNFWLLERLVRIKPLPDDFSKLNLHSRRVIYVLGGSETSLEYRFIAAADLYKKNAAPIVLILSKTGITEYDPRLGRNLTYDEWSVKRLGELGVPKGNIEPLSVKYGLFGTLAEARGVSQEVMSRGDDVLILVSSSYHTARVRETFSKYLSDKNIKVFIYGSDDHPPLWGLLVEYFKLILYKYILL
ncbi:MAG TPA: YdcF family protein [Nitrospirota bacterium]|nr:YdcF family protein [Syntrophales bacterium]HUL00448.1 YdcF family protein [Nitrospirota bacterium]